MGLVSGAADADVDGSRFDFSSMTGARIWRMGWNVWVSVWLYIDWRAKGMCVPPNVLRSRGDGSPAVRWPF